MRNRFLLALVHLGAIASPVLAQSPCFERDLGVDLGLHDETTVQGINLGFSFPYHGVNYSSICVASNGYIVLGATTTIRNDSSPSAAELFASAQPRICPLWTDLDPDPAGSGHVWFRAAPASGGLPARAIITWAGCYEFFTTNPIEVQLVLDATGLMTVTYGTNTPTMGFPVVIGASHGGGVVPNLVSFATRPLSITQDSFAEELLDVQSPTNTQMGWLPVPPGYFVFDTGCQINSLPVPATVESVGVGCPVRTKPSIYEVFSASNPVDVSGGGFTFTPDGQGGYTMTQGAGAFYQGFANNLGAGDDTVITLSLPFAFPHAYGSVSAVTVSSNGFLTLGGTYPGVGCCSGTATELLAGEPRIAAWWGDIDPHAVGGVYADYDFTSGAFVATWNGVPEWGTQSLNTCQIAMFPSGSFEIRLQQVARVSGFFDFLVGYSYGQGALDPGSSDLTAGPHATGPLSFIGPLEQTTAFGVLPTIGSVFQIDFAGISPAPQGNVALLLLGFNELDPGIDLALVGAPGCTAYLLPGPSDMQIPLLVGGAPTTAFLVPVPNSLSLPGLRVTSQVVSDDVGANAFGWKMSNGLRLRVGV